MILENVNTHQEDLDLEASPDFLGEGHELAAVQGDFLSEMHNLTVALARVEHKCLVENNEELMEGAVGEFFKSAGKKIKELWERFIAWLGSMFTRLKDAFVKREEWLSRNKAALNAVTDDALKGIKVSLHAGTQKGGFASLVKDSINEAEKLMTQISNLESSDAGPVKATVERLMKEEKDYLGLQSEVELNKALVGKLIGVAEDTYKALALLPSAKGVAQAGLKYAAALEGTTTGDGKEKANARAAAMRMLAPKIQQLFAGLASSVSTANGQAMSALVKAAGKAAKKEEPKKDDKAAPAAAGAKNEDTSILAAFM